MLINGTQISAIIGDLTKADYVDAIVNPTNSSMVGHSGLNKAIHQAAGENLRKACEKLGKCEVGDAKATDAYNLPCKYIIHTVGPTWQNGEHHESDQLRLCYQNVLETAKGLHIKSIGLSSISTGKKGFPKDKATETAVKTVVDYVKENPQSFDKILWVIQDDETKAAYEKAISARESIENINASVRSVSVPIEAINWNDRLLYGSAVENKFMESDAEKVKGFVRRIDPSGKIETIMIPGDCIKNDGLYYVRKKAVEELQRRGILLCRTIPSEVSVEKGVLMVHHVKVDALLRQHGYAITANMVPTDQQRKTILAMIVKYEHFNPKLIINYLTYTISDKHKLNHIISARIETDIEYLRFLMEADLK